MKYYNCGDDRSHPLINHFCFFICLFHKINTNDHCSEKEVEKHHYQYFQLVK